MLDNAYIAGKKLLKGDYSQFTPTGKEFFAKNGCYGKEPRLGAVVYFYSSAMGRIAHVGGVINVLVNGNEYTIDVSEGNTSEGNKFNRNGGCVAIKRYTFKLNEVGGKNRIQGFGYPAFGDDTCTVEEFIEVLKGEVGYVEKASNNLLDDKKANAGDKNYTKYGKWYGGNGLYWCQQFISWCAYMACKRHLEYKKTGWIQEADNWKYSLHGIIIKGQWLQIGGRWYVFDNAGDMIKGWFDNGDSWYYLNPDDGAMLSGQWLERDNNFYYLTKSGVMAKECYVESNGKYCWVDNDGLYQKEYDTADPDLRKYELAE